MVVKSQPFTVIQEKLVNRDIVLPSKSKKRKKIETVSRRKVIRSVKKHIIQFPNEDGTMRTVTFKDSTW